MSTRSIQVRLSRNPRWQQQGGWEVFEADSVCPVYCVQTGRRYALDYAYQRAHSGLCGIQVVDKNWNVIETITNENLKQIM
jgi:hypothetical protein